MAEILVFKLGASGDVVRTTTLMHILDGNVTWVTKKMNFSLLPLSHPNLKQVLDINEVAQITDKEFDTIVCLEDEEEIAKLASSIKSKNVIGAYWDGEKVTYSDSSAEWFDMGLVSKFGKKAADELKMKNTKTYQEMLFSMFNKPFNGEEYLINAKPSADRNPKLVGIESRAGDRWPTKRWNQFEELADKLRQEGFEVIFFQQRDTIEEYTKDINKCSYVLTGDSLAMHIALALKIKTVAIFTCTSAVEIYGYDRMEKVVSPHLNDAFYKTAYVKEAVESISLEDVYKAFKKLAI